MNIDVKTLTRAVEPMRKLGRMDIPFPAAYAVSKNITAIDSALEYCNERFKALNEKYLAAPNDAHPIYPGAETELNAQLAAIEKETVSIDIEKLPVKSLENINFPPLDVRRIAFMLKE